MISLAPQERSKRSLPRGVALQSGSVEIFYRLTGLDLGLPTGHRGKSGPTTGEQVASGSKRGECQESDSEAANTRLLEECSMSFNADRIYQRAQVPFGGVFALAALYRQRKFDSVTRAVAVS